MKMNKEVMMMLNQIAMMNDIESIFIIEEIKEEKLSAEETMFKIEELKSEVYEELECIDSEPINVSAFNIMQGKDFNLNIERYYTSVSNKISEMENDDDVRDGVLEEFNRAAREIEDNLHLINIYSN